MEDDTYKKIMIVLAAIAAMQNIAIILNALGEAVNELLVAITPYTNTIIIGILVWFIFFKKKE